MIEFLLRGTPLLKSLHIVALCLWCGGLLALPLMLAGHHPEVSQNQYSRIRMATHFLYSFIVTPAAVLTVIAGTWLIFFRQVFVPWLYLKLVCVALLVAAHIWIGHLLVLVAEKPGRHVPPKPYLPMLAGGLPMLAILILVLAKPVFEPVGFPTWLTEPREGQLPFAVPKR